MLKSLVRNVLMAAAAGQIMTTTAAAQQGSAADVIREMQSYYHVQPTCERVQVELRTPGPVPGAPMRVTRSSMVVRLQPGVPKAPDPVGGGVPTSTPSASIGLELAQLQVWASGGSLVAAHTRDPGTYFQAPIASVLTPGAIGEALPPILLPQLELGSADPAGVCSQFWPYAMNINWQTAEPDGKQPGRRIVRGTCEGGTVTITVQGTRLRTLIIDVPAKKAMLTLGFSPFIPCDPAKAAIDTAGRRRVDSMDELRPRSGTLRVGFRLPPMAISQASGQAWDLGELLQPPADALAQGIRPADHAVLVFMRDTPTASAGRYKPEGLAPILRRMRLESFKPRTGAEAEHEPASAIAKFGFAPVIVVAAPKPDELLGMLKSQVEKWGPEVLWTTEPKSTIDLLAPGSDACCVIIDADFVLRSVIVVDPNQTAEQVADQIGAALFELAPGDGR